MILPELWGLHDTAEQVFRKKYSLLPYNLFFMHFSLEKHHFCRKGGNLRVFPLKSISVIKHGGTFVSLGGKQPWTK